MRCSDGYERPGSTGMAQRVVGEVRIRWHGAERVGPSSFPFIGLRVSTHNRCPSRVIVIAAASKRNPYEVLGVPRGATMKDIKRAYRKKALKLHPDVNKASNAKEQFMECKQAYQELIDGNERRTYGGGVGGQSGRSSSWGRSSSSSSSSSSSGSSGMSGSTRDYNYREKSQQEQEEFYGLGDLFRDLENEWQKSRPRNGEPKSLWEELADIGEEFVEFLEKNIPEERSRDDRWEYAETQRQSPSSSTPPRPPPPPEKKTISVDDELAEMKRRMGL